jgi:hypothetical protein
MNIISIKGRYLAGYRLGASLDADANTFVVGKFDGEALTDVTGSGGPIVFNR